MNLLGLTLAVAILGALSGWFVLPIVSDAMLRRVHRRSQNWWKDSLSAYGDFKQAYPNREPSRFAHGMEGALGVWHDEVVRAAEAGSLSVREIDALALVGIPTKGKIGPESVHENAYCYLPSSPQKLLCSFVLAAALVAVWVTQPLTGALALSICVFAMGVAVVCDLQTRCIPLESCTVLALAGGLYQVQVHGLNGLIAGLICGAAIMAISLIMNRILRRRCPGGAIGWGDVRCMVALSIATGLDALGGFALCYTLAALIALAGWLLHKLRMGDGIPMAPCLAIWLGYGIAVNFLLD